MTSAVLDPVEGSAQSGCHFPPWESRFLSPVDESEAGSRPLRELRSETRQSDVAVVNPRIRQEWSEERAGNKEAGTFVSPDEELPVVCPVVRLKPREATSNFRALQQWEAVVDAVTKDSVWVRLIDLTNKNNPEETAELLLKEIPMSDRKFLSPGSVLYWSIGIETAAGGQIQKVSRIRAKRSSAWTSRKISKLREQAHNLFESIVNGTFDAPTTG